MGLSRGRRAAVRVARAAAVVGSLATAACTSFDPTVMVSPPPPRAWEQELAARRAAKDQRFRTDPASSPLLDADRAAFDGLDYWPPTADYYFVGPVNFLAEPQRFTIVSTAGEPRPCEKVGWVRFPLGGGTHTLAVYRLLDSERQEGAADLFLPFMDATTGVETYEAGRYVELTGPPGGPYVLDFNQAYNPLCAYGSPERFSCPRTPQENRLEVRIEAGERGPEERGG